MRVKTLEWKQNKLWLVDQTKLPVEFKIVECTDVQQVWDAIKRLVVRGAPAIGIAAAYGIVIATQNSRARGYGEFVDETEKVADYLAKARPTAVNLFWALDRMKKVIYKNKTDDVGKLKKLLLKEADAIFDEDRETCRNIGRYGATLLKNGDTVLTHCNAGALATADYGTALAAIFVAVEEGKEISVYVDETRPLLQGARLTTWELKQAGIDVTLICDNMAAQVMKEGKVDVVITGADRIASNGDAANKIGTYGLALLGKAHNVPFYIAAPKSSFDMTLKSGDEIPIEQRNPEEVTKGFGEQIAPDGIKVYNPAFDVTPCELIRGIITEKGIVYPPYTENLKKLFASKGSASTKKR